MIVDLLAIVEIKIMMTEPVSDRNINVSASTTPYN